MNSQDIILNNVVYNVFGPKTAEIKNTLTQRYQVINQHGVGFFTGQSNQLIFHDIVNGKMTMTQGGKTHGVK